MSLFKKKPETPVSKTEVTLESLQAENATLTEKVSSLEAELAEAKSTISDYETMEKLSEHAEAIGYFGSVKEFLVKSEGDFGSALSALVLAATKEAIPEVSKVESFLQATNPTLKQESNEGVIKQPKNSGEAVAMIAEANPNVDLITATAMAMEKYPNLFDRPEGE